MAASEQKESCSNKHQCGCPDGHCVRHGKCCECVSYHKSQGNLPKCLRPKQE